MSAVYPLSGSSPGSTETVKRGLSPVFLLPNHFLSLFPSSSQHLRLPFAFALFPHTIIYLFIPFSVLFSIQHSDFSPICEEKVPRWHRRRGHAKWNRTHKQHIREQKQKPFFCGDTTSLTVSNSPLIIISSDACVC